jgi:hypothetical protein
MLSAALWQRIDVMLKQRISSLPRECLRCIVSVSVYNWSDRVDRAP